MDQQIAARMARTIRPLTVQTTRSDVTRVVTQVQQRVQRSIGNENDVGAAAAVAARWTTTGHKLLTAESSNSVTSVTTVNVNPGPVNEHLNQANQIATIKQTRRPARMCDAAQASRTCAKSCLSSSRLLQGIDADELAGTALVLKLHHTVDQSKERVVLAAADVVAGFPLRAALTRDDVAAEYVLAAKFLEPQTLRLRVASVTR